MKNEKFYLSFFIILLLSINVFAAKNNWYEKSRYGLFVHYVPEINHNKVISSERLKVPDFERLSNQSQKPVREGENHKEMLELQECTFPLQIFKYIDFRITTLIQLF